VALHFSPVAQARLEGEKYNAVVGLRRGIRNLRLRLLAQGKFIQESDLEFPFRAEAIVDLKRAPAESAWERKPNPLLVKNLVAPLEKLTREAILLELSKGTPGRDLALAARDFVCRVSGERTLSQVPAA